MISVIKIARVALLLGLAAAQQLIASVQISPSNVSVNPGQTVQFTATGDPYGIYLWSISGAGCSGAPCGMITYSGTYTAPAAAPGSQPILITATSWVDSTQSATATVTIGNTPVISVAVSPSQVSLNLGASQLFTATVSGTANTGVTWSVSGLNCSGTGCGTISVGGLYTAPTTMPAISSVTVKATSKADTTKSGTATVALISSVSVTVSPQTAKLFPGRTQQFLAQVTGTTVAGVTWSVSGGGCSGAACGTITSTGLYTAPAAVPSSPTVNVKATSVADPRASGTATVTLLTPLAIAISPKSVAIISGAQVQFHDTITGTSDTAVTWSVSGTNCSGTACGTISTTGLYTSPSDLIAQLDVKVTVALKNTPSILDTATVTILRANNAKLTGHYAFQISAYDAYGLREIVGSINADGKGKITDGLEDVNDLINPATHLAISGTYQIRSDNRGSITIKGPLGTQTLDVALNADGTKGRLISFDTSGVRGSGALYRQTTSDFDPAALLGGYAIELTGLNRNWARMGALGLIFPDGGGFISGSSLDVNEFGTASPTYATFSGTYDIDTTGRGTMTLIIPGFEGGVFNFAFYVVSADRLLLLSIDPLSFANPIFSGSAQRQTLDAFTSDQFPGSSIFYVNGRAFGKGDVTVGRLNFKAGNAIGVNYDRNLAGMVSVGKVMTGAYSVQLNGRVTFNLVNPSDGSISTWLMYATGPDTGFVLDMSSNSVRIGEVVRQVEVPFSNASLVGTFMIGSGSPLAKSAPLNSGYMNFDGSVSKNGSGAVTGMVDTSLASSLLPDRAVSGTYSISLVSNNGQGSIRLTAPATSTYLLWVAGPAQAMALPADAAVDMPTVLYIEQ